MFIIMCIVMSDNRNGLISFLGKNLFIYLFFTMQMHSVVRFPPNWLASPFRAKRGGQTAMQL